MKTKRYVVVCITRTAMPVESLVGKTLREADTYDGICGKVVGVLNGCAIVDTQPDNPREAPESN